MEKSQILQVKDSSQSCNPILTLGGRVSQGTMLTVLAVAGVGAGLVLGWDSLVALGLSSFILALLPCAVMCALGLCMHRMSKKRTDLGEPVGDARDRHTGREDGLSGRAEHDRV